MNLQYHNGWVFLERRRYGLSNVWKRVFKLSRCTLPREEKTIMTLLRPNPNILIYHLLIAGFELSNHCETKHQKEYKQNKTKMGAKQVRHIWQQVRERKGTRTGSISSGIFFFDRISWLFSTFVWEFFLENLELRYREGKRKRKIAQKCREQWVTTDGWGGKKKENMNIRK